MLPKIDSLRRSPTFFRLVIWLDVVSFSSRTFLCFRRRWIRRACFGVDQEKLDAQSRARPCARNQGIPELSMLNWFLQHLSIDSIPPWNGHEQDVLCYSISSTAMSGILRSYYWATYLSLGAFVLSLYWSAQLTTRCVQSSTVRFTIDSLKRFCMVQHLW